MSEDNIVTIVVAIIGLLALGISITIYIRIRSKKKSNKVVIKDNIAGGDIAGGNIKKKINE